MDNKEILHWMTETVMPLMLKLYTIVITIVAIACVWALKNRDPDHGPPRARPTEAQLHDYFDKRHRLMMKMENKEDAPPQN